VCYVSDIVLYSIRAGILSQWSFLRTGVMWRCFWVLFKARSCGSAFPKVCSAKPKVPSG